MHPLCAAGLHVYPLVDRERFQAAKDPFWHDFGNCPRCRNTIRDPGDSGEQDVGALPSPDVTTSVDEAA